MKQTLVLIIFAAILCLSGCTQQTPVVKDPFSGQWDIIESENLKEIRSLLYIHESKTLIAGCVPEETACGIQSFDIETRSWNKPFEVNSVDHIFPQIIRRNDSIYAIQFSNSANPGLLWISSDAGITWQPGPTLPDGTDPRCIAFTGENLETIFLGTVNSGLFYSEDNGETWVAPTGVAPDAGIQEIAVDSGNSDHLLAGIRTGIIQSVDGGKSWSDITSTFSTANVFIVTVKAHPKKPGTFTAISRDSVGSAEIILSTDSAKTWKPIRQGLYDDSQPRCIQYHHTNENIIYIGTAIDGIYYTENLGTLWTPINTGLPLDKQLIIHCMEQPDAPSNMVIAGSNIEGHLYIREF